MPMSISFSNARLAVGADESPALVMKSVGSKRVSNCKFHLKFSGIV